MSGKNDRYLLPYNSDYIMNFYNIFKEQAPTAFHVVKELESLLVGASRIEGNWPYPQYSRHKDPEIVVVIDGSVEIEYDDGERVIRTSGEVEEMKGNRGHKVHQHGNDPANVLLIFPKNN